MQSCNYSKSSLSYVERTTLNFILNDHYKKKALFLSCLFVSKINSSEISKEEGIEEFYFW